MKSPLTRFLIVMALSAFTTLSVLAQSPCVPANTAPGSLDTCFGSGGTVITTVPGTANNNWALYVIKTLVQSDGKIITLIDAHLSGGPSHGFTNVIVRYNADGSLDDGTVNDATPADSFGSGGIAYMNWTNPDGSFGNAYSMAIQNIGGEERIAVGGTGPLGLGVVRLLNNGSPDTSFGSGGRADLSGGTAYAMAAQPWDQKLIAASDSFSGSTVARLNLGGTLDGSFGQGGVARTATSIDAKGIAFQSNQKILIGGAYRLKSGASQFGVARFNINGTLDSTFGTSGKAVNDPYGGGGYATSIIVDSSDRVLLAGTATQRITSKASYTYWNILGFAANGQLDTSFGSAGKAAWRVDTGDSRVRSIARQQSDGKFVLFGSSAGVNGFRDFTLVRFNATGSIDTMFGQAGVAKNNLLGGHDDGDGTVQIDPACNCERLVMAGASHIANATSGYGGQGYATAARYIP